MRYQLPSIRMGTLHLTVKNDREHHFKEFDQREQQRNKIQVKIEQPMMVVHFCTLESLLGYMDFPGEWRFLCYSCVVHIDVKKCR